MAGRLIRESGGPVALDVRDVRTGNVVRLRGNLDEAGGGDDTPTPPARPRFGAVAVAYQGGPGLFVTHLVPDTPAARLQLDYGDILLQINGRSLSDQEDYAAAVRESGRTMDLLIINVRTGQRQSMRATLDY